MEIRFSVLSIIQTPISSDNRGSTVAHRLVLLEIH